MKVSLLHPFSARAVGLSEDDLLYSHSKPHVTALKQIQHESLSITIDYFTGSLFFKKYLVEGMEKRFWPISNSFFKKRHTWKKQFSRSQLRFYFTTPPDLTIINTSGHGSEYVFRLAKILNQKNKPYIAMIGGMNVSYKGDAFDYYKNASHIIVHTEIQKQLIKNIKLFSDFDIRVVPLGVDTDKFKPLNLSLVEIKGKLLFVGRVTRLKQVEIAIETLHYLRLNNFIFSNLTIIGPIVDQDYFTELKDKINTLGLLESVNFLGSIDQEKLFSYYQNAEILLLPSKTESFGMVITEAMACGIPVAAIEGAGGPDEIIQNDFNGILVSREKYSESILKLLSDGEKYKVLKSNSRITVLKKYSILVTTELIKESIDLALET